MYDMLLVRTTLGLCAYQELSRPLDNQCKNPRLDGVVRKRGFRDTDFGHSFFGVFVGWASQAGQILVGSANEPES